MNQLEANFHRLNKCFQLWPGFCDTLQCGYLYRVWLHVAACFSTHACLHCVPNLHIKLINWSDSAHSYIVLRKFACTKKGAPIKLRSFSLDKINQINCPLYLLNPLFTELVRQFFRRIINDPFEKQIKQLMKSRSDSCVTSRPQQFTETITGCQAWKFAVHARQWLLGEVQGQQGMVKRP